MIALAVRQRVTLGAIYIVLAAVLAVAAFAAGLQSHDRIVTRTDHVVRAPGTGAGVVAAWGTPDQTIDGATINPSLQGATCALYQSRSTLVCYAG